MCLVVETLPVYLSSGSNLVELAIFLDIHLPHDFQTSDFVTAADHHAADVCLDMEQEIVL